MAIDPEDVQYEDSVSTDSWLEEAYEDAQSGSLWSDPCISYEEDPGEYYDDPMYDAYPHDEDEGLNPLVGYAETEILF